MRSGTARSWPRLGHHAPIGAASHSAEPIHLALVQRVLDRFGLDANDLRCGAHPPMHEPSAAAMLRAGEDFSTLHNNCSGKHAFMVAASRHVDAASDYLPPEHPLQRLILDRLKSWTGHDPKVAIDGCGVPTFCMPVSALAQAFSQLACSMSSMNEPCRLGKIGWAMARHPDLTAGTGRLDPWIVRRAREPIAAKIGAMGVFCIALPARNMGLAIKVASGSTEALPVAVAAALEAAAKGAWEEPVDWPFRKVTNVAGRVVGEWQSST